MDDRDELTVCYNGACPVCRAEIGHYRRLAREDARLRFLDVAADPDGAARLGLVGELPFRRLHVVDRRGRLVGGVDAFVKVWRRLPGYGWVGRLVAWRPVRAIASLAYERVAAPSLYAWHRLRMRRLASGRG